MSVSRSSAAPKCHAAPTFSSAVTGSPSSTVSEGSCWVTWARYGTASEPELTTGLFRRSRSRRSLSLARCRTSLDVQTALSVRIKSMSAEQPSRPLSETRRLSLTSRACRRARGRRPSAEATRLPLTDTVRRKSHPSRPSRLASSLPSTRRMASDVQAPTPSRDARRLWERSSLIRCGKADTKLASSMWLCARLSSCKLTGDGKAAPSLESRLWLASSLSRCRWAPRGCRSRSLLWLRSTSCSCGKRATGPSWEMKCAERSSTWCATCRPAPTSTPGPVMGGSSAHRLDVRPRMSRRLRWRVRYWAMVLLSST
mmetsp:Transcript_1993/g.6610  ORF Transcript_1993/g.6610 Transcript_1993/m.6610 type:complete len:313 (+) Transcript_1993:305-1243(+)